MKKRKFYLKRRTFLKGAIGILGTGFPLNASKNDRECETTQEDMLGPYWSQDHPERVILANLDEPGTRIQITGLVTANDCSTPIPNASVDVWHANDQGCYTIFQNCTTGNTSNDDYNLRGIMFTNENGMYSFESILPGYYPGRPRHFHYKITTPSGVELVTQCYFENDSLITTDFIANNGDLVIPLNESNNNLLNGVFNISINQSAEELLLDNSDTLNEMEFSITNAYPNPFNNSIKIDYEVLQKGHVALEIFDINGKWIKTLANSMKNKGRYSNYWDGLDFSGNIVSSGAYLVVIKYGKRIKTKKINFLK